MNEITKAVPMFQRNAIGLRPAHAALYVYLKNCTDEQKQVQIDDVVDIYWNNVKGGSNALICPSCGGELQYIKFKDAKEILKNDYSRYNVFVIRPAKQWFQNTIGNLVVRGFITIIPNFDAKLIEE